MDPRSSILSFILLLLVAIARASYGTSITRDVYTLTASLDIEPFATGAASPRNWIRYSNSTLSIYEEPSTIPASAVQTTEKTLESSGTVLSSRYLPPPLDYEGYSRTQKDSKGLSDRVLPYFNHEDFSRIQEEPKGLPGHVVPYLNREDNSRIQEDPKSLPGNIVPYFNREDYSRIQEDPKSLPGNIVPYFNREDYLKTQKDSKGAPNHVVQYSNYEDYLRTVKSPQSPPGRIIPYSNHEDYSRTLKNPQSLLNHGVLYPNYEDYSRTLKNSESSPSCLIPYSNQEDYLRTPQNPKHPTNHNAQHFNHEDYARTQKDPEDPSNRAILYPNHEDYSTTQQQSLLSNNPKNTLDPTTQYPNHEDYLINQENPKNHPDPATQYSNHEDYSRTLQNPKNPTNHDAQYSNHEDYSRTLKNPKNPTNHDVQYSSHEDYSRTLQNPKNPTNHDAQYSSHEDYSPTHEDPEDSPNHVEPYSNHEDYPSTQDDPEGPPDHVIPYSSHEDTKEVPTKPKYKAPGEWAKPPSDKTVELDFVPTKLYAQVRTTHTMKRVPREEALKEAQTEEERLEALRLREVVTNSKVNTVYTEEGYEDSAYDHAGHVRDADFHEGFARKERDQLDRKRVSHDGEGEKRKKGERSRKKKGKYRVDPKEFEEFEDDYRDHPVEEEEEEEEEEEIDDWHPTADDPKRTVERGIRKLEKDVEKEEKEAEADSEINKTVELHKVTDDEPDDEESVRKESHNSKDQTDEPVERKMQKKKKKTNDPREYYDNNHGSSLDVGKRVEESKEKIDDNIYEEAMKITEVPPGKKKALQNSRFEETTTKEDPKSYLQSPTIPTRTTPRYRTPMPSHSSRPPYTTPSRPASNEESSTVSYSELLWNFYKSQQNQPKTTVQSPLIQEPTTSNPSVEQQTAVAVATINGHGPYLLVTKQEPPETTIQPNLVSSERSQPRKLYTEADSTSQSTFENLLNPGNQVDYVQKINSLLFTPTVAALSDISSTISQFNAFWQPLTTQETIFPSPTQASEGSLDAVASSSAPTQVVSSLESEEIEETRGEEQFNTSTENKDDSSDPTIQSSNSTGSRKPRYKILVRNKPKKYGQSSQSFESSTNRRENSMENEKNETPGFKEIEVNANYMKVLNYLRSNEHTRGDAPEKNEGFGFNRQQDYPEDLTIMKPPRASRVGDQGYPDFSSNLQPGESIVVDQARLRIEGSIPPRSKWKQPQMVSRKQHEHPQITAPRNPVNPPDFLKIPAMFGATYLPIASSTTRSISLERKLIPQTQPVSSRTKLIPTSTQALPSTARLVLPKTKLSAQGGRVVSPTYSMEDEYIRRQVDNYVKQQNSGTSRYRNIDQDNRGNDPVGLQKDDYARRENIDETNYKDNDYSDYPTGKRGENQKHDFFRHQNDNVRNNDHVRLQNVDQAVYQNMEQPIYQDDVYSDHRNKKKQGKDYLHQQNVGVRNEDYADHQNFKRARYESVEQMGHPSVDKIQRQKIDLPRYADSKHFKNQDRHIRYPKDTLASRKEKIDSRHPEDYHMGRESSSQVRYDHHNYLTYKNNDQIGHQATRGNDQFTHQIVPRGTNQFKHQITNGNDQFGQQIILRANDRFKHHIAGDKDQFRHQTTRDDNQVGQELTSRGKIDSPIAEYSWIDVIGRRNRRSVGGISNASVKGSLKHGRTNRAEMEQRGKNVEGGRTTGVTTQRCEVTGSGDRNDRVKEILLRKSRNSESRIKSATSPRNKDSIDKRTKKKEENTDSPKIIATVNGNYNKVKNGQNFIEKKTRNKEGNSDSLKIIATVNANYDKVKDGQNFIDKKTRNKEESDDSLKIIATVNANYDKVKNGQNFIHKKTRNKDENTDSSKIIEPLNGNYDKVKNGQKKMIVRKWHKGKLITRQNIEDKKPAGFEVDDKSEKKLILDGNTKNDNTDTDRSNANLKKEDRPKEDPSKTVNPQKLKKKRIVVKKLLKPASLSRRKRSRPNSHEQLLNEAPRISAAVIDREIESRFKDEEDKNQTEKSNETINKEIEVDVPEFDYVEELVEEDHPKISTTTKATLDPSKYPFYRVQKIPSLSPLKYTIDPRRIPRKTAGGMEFYDSRDAYKECVDVEPNLEDVVPEEEEPVGDRGPKEDLPRLRGLGDKLDCFKAKYFDETPFDNPLFLEKQVEDPTPPSELDPKAFVSRILRLPKENDDYVVQKSSRAPERSYVRPGERGSRNLEENETIGGKYKLNPRIGDGRNLRVVGRLVEEGSKKKRTNRMRDGKRRGARGRGIPVMEKPMLDAPQYQSQVYEDVMGNIQNLVNSYQVHEVSTVEPFAQVLATAASEDLRSVTSAVEGGFKRDRDTGVPLVDITESPARNNFLDIEGLLPPKNSARYSTGYGSSRALTNTRSKKSPNPVRVIGRYQKIHLHKRSLDGIQGTFESRERGVKTKLQERNLSREANGGKFEEQLVQLSTPNVTHTPKSTTEQNNTNPRDPIILPAPVKGESKRRRLQNAAQNASLTIEKNPKGDQNETSTQRVIYTIKDRIRYSKPKEIARGFGKFTGTTTLIEEDSRRREPTYNYVRRKKHPGTLPSNSTSASNLTSELTDQILLGNATNATTAAPEAKQNDTINELRSEATQKSIQTLENLNFDSTKDSNNHEEPGKVGAEKSNLPTTDRPSKGYDVYEKINEDVSTSTLASLIPITPGQFSGLKAYLAADPPGYAEAFPEEFQKSSHQAKESNNNFHEDQKEPKAYENRVSKDNDEETNIHEPRTSKESSQEKSEVEDDSPSDQKEEEEDTSNHEKDSKQEDDSEHEKDAKHDFTFSSRPSSPAESFEDEKYSDLGPRINKPAFHHPPFPIEKYKGDGKATYREGVEEDDEEDEKEDYVFPWHRDKELEKQESLKLRSEPLGKYEFPWERRERLEKERRARQREKYERLKEIFGEDEDSGEGGTLLRRGRYVYPWEKYDVPSEKHVSNRRDTRGNHDDEQIATEVRPLKIVKFSSRYNSGYKLPKSKERKRTSAGEISRSIRKILEDDSGNESSSSSEERIEPILLPTKPRSEKVRGLSRGMIVPEEVTLKPIKKTRRKNPRGNITPEKSTTARINEDLEKAFADLSKLKDSKLQKPRLRIKVLDAISDVTTQPPSTNSTTKPSRRRGRRPLKNTTDIVEEGHLIEPITASSQRNRRRQRAQNTTSSTTARTASTTPLPRSSKRRQQRLSSNDTTPLDTSTTKAPSSRASRADRAEGDPKSKARNPEHRSKLSKEAIEGATPYPEETTVKSTSERPIGRRRSKVAKGQGKNDTTVRSEDAGGKPEEKSRRKTKEGEEEVLKKPMEEVLKEPMEEVLKEPIEKEKISDGKTIRQKDLARFATFDDEDQEEDYEDDDDEFEDALPPEVYQAGNRMLIKPILPAKRAQRIEKGESNRSEASRESDDYSGSEEETSREEIEDAEAEEEERLAKLRVKYIKDPGQRLYYYIERRK